jgi:hypothetical protein
VYEVGEIVLVQFACDWMQEEEVDTWYRAYVREVKVSS